MSGSYPPGPSPDRLELRPATDRQANAVVLIARLLRQIRDKEAARKAAEEAPARPE